MRALAFLLFRVVFALVAITLLVIALLGFLPPPFTAFMLEASIERGELVRYDWAPRAELPPLLLVSLVAAEDQRFAEHSGFDFGAIERATKHNARGGSIRGASTISQQVAKNLFLWPGRSWLRKGLEAAITVGIEALWPKRRILEVYANVAEMGDGVFGAGAAAERFFGKPASALNASEAALLAAVLPDPHDYRVDAPSASLRRRQQWILRQVKALGGEAWLRRIDAAPKH